MWVLGDVTSSSSQNDSHLTNGDDPLSPQQAALLRSTFTLCTMALYGRTTERQLLQQQYHQQWRRKKGADEDDSAAESHHAADRIVRSEWDDQAAIDVQDLIREVAASNSSCTSSSLSVRLHHRVGCAVLGWLLATMRAAPPLPASTPAVSASLSHSNDGCESTVIGNEMKQRARTAVYDALLLLLRTLSGRSAALIGGGGVTSNAVDTLHPNPLSYRPVEWIQWRRVLLHSALPDSAKGRRRNSGTNVEQKEEEEEETFLRDVLQCVLVGPSCQWHCLWHRTTDNGEQEVLRSGGGGGDNAAPAGEEDPTSSAAGACAAAAVVGVQLLQLLTSQIAELTATQEEEEDDDDEEEANERQEAHRDECLSTSTRCRTSLLLDKVYRSLTTQVENPQTEPSGEAREDNEGVQKKQSKSLLRSESMIDAIKRGYGSGSVVPRSGGISPRVGAAASSVANARARRQSVVSHDVLIKFQTAYCRWQCLPPPHSSDSTVALAMTPRSSSFLRPAPTASGRSTTPLSSRPPSARVGDSQYHPPVEDALSVDTSRATAKDVTGTTTPTQPVASEAALTATTPRSSTSSSAEPPQSLQHKEERGNSRAAQNMLQLAVDSHPYRCAPFAKLVQQQQEQTQKEDPAAAGLSSYSQSEPSYDGSLQSATELIAANKQTLNDWMSAEVERWTSRRAIDAVAELRQLTQWAVAISQGGQEESSGVPIPLESLPAEFLHEVATTFRNSHPHSHCATDQMTSSSSEGGLSLFEDMIDLLTERLEERIVLNVA